MMKIAIVVTGIHEALNTWTMATASVDGREYCVQMVRFEEPSRFGIRNGRISKLWACGPSGIAVIDYDRTWSTRPGTAAGKALLAAILRKFN